MPMPWDWMPWPGNTYMVRGPATTALPIATTPSAVVASTDTIAGAVAHAGAGDREGHLLAGQHRGHEVDRPTRAGGSESPSAADSRTARVAAAEVHMPWTMRPGRPTNRASRSLRWIGLASPLTVANASSWLGAVTVRVPSVRTGVATTPTRAPGAVAAGQRGVDDRAPHEEPVGARPWRPARESHGDDQAAVGAGDARARRLTATGRGVRRGRADLVAQVHEVEHRRGQAGVGQAGEDVRPQGRHDPVGKGAGGTDGRGVRGGDVSARTVGPAVPPANIASRPAPAAAQARLGDGERDHAGVRRRPRRAARARRRRAARGPASPA